MRYRVTFERIGRNRAVEPLEVNVDGPNHLAELIHQYARPHLMSRDVEIYVDPDGGAGHILCGFNNGGTFAVARLAAATGGESA
jgi:hypothetical protein